MTRMLYRQPAFVDHMLRELRRCHICRQLIDEKPKRGSYNLVYHPLCWKGTNR